MIVFRKAANAGEWCADMREEGLSIGFVPTMGALHRGHISLVEEARRRCDVVVASIFVNPTQFNNAGDLENYPVTLESDQSMLRSAGCDAVFIPTVQEVYPDGQQAGRVEVDLGYIGACLEAEHRPGHFEGVMQVVKRLLDVVNPDKLLLGRKDYQQCLVIRRMVEAYKLPVEVVQCPTVREADGLAMSSRNIRLSPGARREAAEIYRALQAICRDWREHGPHHLTKIYTDKLNAFPQIDVEYLEITDSESLRPISAWSEAGSAVVFAAVWAGGVRLIDNATIY